MCATTGDVIGTGVARGRADRAAGEIALIVMAHRSVAAACLIP